MLLARSVLAIAAQGLVAAIYAMQGSEAPWRDAGAWLPLYGTLIDAGCLALLWWLTRREGIRLSDLIGFDRNRIGQDVLLGLFLIPASLAFIFGGIFIGNILIYGAPGPVDLGAPLPLLPALYAVLIWPLIWGITEQMAYNGYLVPRFQVLSGNTALTVAIIGFIWAFQHAVMPLTSDPDFMMFRTLAALPNTIFFVAVYLYLRRLLPLVIAHWLMDGASAFMASFLPLLQQ